MKRLIIVLMLVVIISLVKTGISDAYVFQPDPTDLWDLPHGYYFEWGIDWPLPAGETITKATLFIDDIDDWTHPEDDHLYIHLLDNLAAGTRYYSDSSSWPDAFSGQGYLIDTYIDPGPGAVDLTYDIPSAYFSWLSDGNFGFGFDPDCHYKNTGIRFEIATAPIPEPASLTLLGLGLLGLLGFRKRRG